MNKPLVTGSRDEAPCPNCESALLGDWCHVCGQKRIVDDERRVSWLIRDFAAKVTSFDGKLVRSLLALIFQPGRLGAEWLAGRRVRWAAPIGLFLVINVLYFVAPPVTDFNLSLWDQLTEQAYSDWAVAQVERRFPGVAEWVESGGELKRPEGYSPFAAEFNQRAPNLSKVLLVFQVPLVAFMLCLLHWRRRIHFVDHFAVALHFWTFLLLALMAIKEISHFGSMLFIKAGWFNSESDAMFVWKLTLILGLSSHLIMVLRRAYQQPLPLAIVKMVPVAVACVLSHLSFRFLLFVITYFSL